MARIAFADESGTNGNPGCYSIGVVSLDAANLVGFERHFNAKLESHGVQGEGKWTKIRGSHGLINFTLDALNSILHSGTASFDVIVVNTSLFRNWNLMPKEDAFYQTFTYLLCHIANRANLPSEIFIDDRSDSYPKRDEMMETIGNNMLAKIASGGRLSFVKKINSRESVGVQIADLLTGAVNAAHTRWLHPELVLHSSKQLTIERLAKMLDWDDLCYDTYPSDKFNIWHFPTEYRAKPRTSRISLPSRIPFVFPVDLLTGQTNHQLQHP